MSIVLFIIILLILILVHEFGHFIVAKKSGIRVDEFGVGYPPKVFGKKIGETNYTINLLPFGGFVKIFGENPDEESISGPERKRSFVNKPKWVQAIVLSAGVVFNVLFAWILFSVVFMIGMPSIVTEDDLVKSYVQEVQLTITSVLPDSPASNAGLQIRDEIVRIEVISGLPVLDQTNKIITPSDVSKFINESPKYGENIRVFYNRAGEQKEVVLNPITGIIPDDISRPAIGISMSLVGSIKHGLFVSIWEGLKFTTTSLIAITVGIVSFLASALTLSANLSDVAGPVGIVSLVGDVSALGFIFLLNFTAFISINLAIINLLPFPALDGGRLLFLLIEVIKKSPIKPKVANAINAVGFALLIILMVVITFNDISRIISG